MIQERVIFQSQAAANQEIARQDPAKRVDRSLQEIIHNRIVMEEARVNGIPEVTEEKWGLQRADWWNELKGKSSIWIAPELVPEPQKSERTEVHAGHE